MSDPATIIGILFASTGVVTLVKPLFEALSQWLHVRKPRDKVTISVTDRDGLVKELELENLSSKAIDEETLKRIVKLLEEADGGRTEDSSKE
jgi:hypothetical protein